MTLPAVCHYKTVTFIKKLMGDALYTVNSFMCPNKFILSENLFYLFFNKLDPVITTFVEADVAKAITVSFLL